MHRAILAHGVHLRIVQGTLCQVQGLPCTTTTNYFTRVQLWAISWSSTWARCGTFLGRLLRRRLWLWLLRGPCGGVEEEAFARIGLGLGLFGAFPLLLRGSLGPFVDLGEVLVVVREGAVLSLSAFSGLCEVQTTLPDERCGGPRRHAFLSNRGSWREVRRWYGTWWHHRLRTVCRREVRRNCEWWHRGLCAVCRHELRQSCRLWHRCRHEL
mmetsp:Transcript_5948/g.12847  ORF Transcript_5948/g.12847 Transcript_5948/m.12847 type:complete len:212 (-) Transcript_5948:723-1358(-)